MMRILYWDVYLGRFPLPGIGRLISRSFPFVADEREVEALLSKTKLNATFVDVGAYMGIYTKLMLTRAPFVISIEPGPVNMFMMRRRLGSPRNLKYVQAAIGDRRGRVILHRNRRCLARNNITPSKQEDTFDVNVPLITLADIVRRRAGLVKVDVEGAELQVVEGAKPVMHLIDSWIVEVHQRAIGTHLWDTLEQYGYSIEWLDEHHLYASR